MEILLNVLVLAHVIGMACVVGGWISLRARHVESGPGLSVVVWGARAQILTGLLLVGIHEMNDDVLNHAKIGTKLVIALAAVGSAEVARSRSRNNGEPAVLIDSAGLFGVLATAVAVLWS